MRELAHLGFTFYPKDWWTSETFYALEPIERYFYLECIFLMYVEDGSIADDKGKVERRLGTTIKDGVWLKVSSMLVKTDDGRLTHRSVNNRIEISERNRINGSKGGAPIGNRNAVKNNQNNPKKQPIKQPKNKAKIIEREREYKSEDEVKDEDEVTPSPTFSDSDLIRDIDNLAKEAFEDKVYFVEHVSRKFSLTPEAIKTSLMNFNDHLKSLGEMVKSKRDYRTHFQNWLRKQQGIIKHKKSNLKQVDLSKI